MLAWQRVQVFKTDRELQVGASHDILDLKVQELGREAELLYDPCVLPRRQFGLVLALGARAHHLAGAEDECRGPGRPDAHDERSEALRVVLGVSGLQSHLLQVQTTSDAYCAHDVLEMRQTGVRVISCEVVQRC